MDKATEKLAERSLGQTLLLAWLIEFFAAKGLYDMGEVIRYLDGRLLEVEGTGIKPGGLAPTIDLIELLRVAVDRTPTQ